MPMSFWLGDSLASLSACAAASSRFSCQRAIALSIAAASRG
jgi:hypothetical protein